MNWSDVTPYLPTFDPAAPWLPQILTFALWGGTFVCTVLVIRMIITRWGDSNVTAKAVVLSALVHALAGVWTTTVMLAPARLIGRDKVIPLREVIAERPPEDVRKPLEGEPAAWERLSQPRTAVTRAPQDIPDPRADEPQRLRPDQELSAVALPDVSAPDRPMETAPELLGNDSQRPPGAAPESIDEQTAEARPDVAVAAPMRTRRAPDASLTATPNRRPLDPPRRIADLSPRETPVLSGPEAQARPAVALPTDDSGERPRAAQSARPEATDLADGAEGQSPTGSQPSASGRFRRTGRKSNVDIDGDESQPDRTSARNVSTDTETSLGNLLSSKLTTTRIGEPSPRAVSPDGDSTVRSISRMPERYRLRGAIQRREFAPQYGATDATEKAVEAALAWMAHHQSPAGNWDPDGFTAFCPAAEKCTGAAIRGKDPEAVTLESTEREQRERSGIDSDTGITGLVLLSYLGAGYTHMDGPYADQVDRALRWLIRGQQQNGYLGGKASYYAGIYCHGMATIALAEAYVMTRDETLRTPLQRAVQYIVNQQNTTDGGWRYEKAQVSDMSVFGWQLMALHSAQAAGITIPKATLDKANEFLQKSALGERGGLAGYGSHSYDKRVKQSMTAEALFCRQLVGARRTDPAVLEAVAYIDQRPPTLKNYDLYCWYYATLAMYHHGGEPWERWNSSLQSSLLSLQRTQGHSAGSWDPYPPWGDYGGRLFSTAMSTLCLEVYYRFTPGE